MFRPRLLLLSLLAVGCNNSHLVATTASPGYLATDTCTGNADQKSCVAANGCVWVDAPPCPAGVKCPTGVCYQPDPCLLIDDAAACTAKTGCAWSQAADLCPVGAGCPNKGYCHPQDPNGGPCSCVTPLGCPANGACPPPECDCNGGGTGGGTCTCAAPDCAPGQACPPAQCTCDPGGGTGGGCVDNGTCTCACPACPAGTTCPPCNCTCGSGGPVPAPMTGANGGTGGGTGGAPGMGAPSPNDPCSAFTDETTCLSHNADQCQWFGIGAPCANGDPNCKSGVCQLAPTTGCGCACPGCPAGAACPPCQCDCGGGGGGGCTPPPVPPTMGGTTPCPAIGCAMQCPNGYQKDASGCTTCTCA